MSHHPGTPRSATFSPTLGSIPEVFEYDSLDAQFGSASLNDAPETPEAFLPETSSMSPPTLTRATSWPAIIQSPSRRVASPFAVSKALRRILEADRARRRRIMRVYLKAIVFLKYLWRANERYGNVMVTTGISQFNTIHSKYSNTKTDACQNVPKFTATYPREQANNKLLNQSGPLSDHGLKSNQ
ncbi:hypothetical protein A1F96_05728 [Pyrenophora tritici-repentis]|nr:hypothetical protein Alg215_09748 [Pyrenophora tritici-repentis]KAI0606735.1 hypothetical protein TUN205_09014 [Pyrenophora tritici-repentis]PZD28667.1 hypothetical protein A1F96_05728 [Pyrenophora tritici-repentis]